MNKDRFFIQKARNLWQTVALLLGMMALMLSLGYLLLGPAGLIWGGIISMATLYLGTSVPVPVIMRWQRGRRLSYHEAPQLLDIMQQLSQQAGLEKTPDLYYIPSRALNAFATGNRKEAAIGITDALLRQMDLRELTGILAHEMSHIRNNDVRWNALMNIMGRMTRTFAFVGGLILLINFPLWLMGEFTLPAIFVLLLLVAPTLSTLMLLAFSRTREFEADLEAAKLTGDPNGLADALQKLHYLNKNSLVNFLNPIQQWVVPKILRTHPTMKERINRLRELAPRYTFKLPGLRHLV